jgi:hypothetical protein
LKAESSLADDRVTITRQENHHEDHGFLTRFSKENLEEASMDTPKEATIQEASPKEGTKDYKKNDVSFDTSSGSDDSAPELDLYASSSVCCADRKCCRPVRSYLMVRCYDCKNFYHQNECGDTIDLSVAPGQKDKTRYLCLQCLFCAAVEEMFVNIRERKRVEFSVCSAFEDSMKRAVEAVLGK